jgi:UDP-2,3-diacylglucosamine pyrophosphatase LpxH
MGRISNELYDWLADDLDRTDKKNIFIFGHQPMQNDTNEGKNVLVNEAYKEFCKDSARSYGKDSLSWFNSIYTSKIKSREAFWNLLKEHNVTAYFCGHTHHYSAKKYDGIWEINLEFGAWNIEGRTRYGEIFIDKGKVDLLVKGYIEKTNNFKVIDRVSLKN